MNYFEIGGEIVECSTSPPSTQIHDPSGVSQIAQQPARAARNGQAKRSRAASPRMDIDVLGKAGHAKRATWAVRTAAALMAVDGPLPVGDVVAITVLAAYAGYEVSRIVME